MGRGGVTSTGLNFTKVDVVFLVRVGLGLGNPVVRDVDGLGLSLVTVGGVYGLTITTVVRDVEVVRGRGTLTVVSFSEVDLTFDDFIVDLSTVFVVDRRLLVTGVAGKGSAHMHGYHKHINKTSQSPLIEVDQVLMTRNFSPRPNP